MPETRWDFLKEGLEHGRSVFVYHAGQRVASLNFYVTALAFLVAAIVALITGTSFPWRAQVGMILSAGVFIITLCLWALDWRNSMLVDADEKLLKVIEKEVATLSGIREFEIIAETDESRPRFVRYGNILGLTFVVFLSLSVLGFWFFARLWCAGV